MFFAPSSSVTDRFATAMVALRKVLFERHSLKFGQPVMVVMVAISYLRRGEGRFLRLMERYRAGMLVPPKPRKPQPKRVRPDAADDETPKPQRFSQAFGWLAKLMRPDGYQFADQLRETLADPETQAAMHASPQVARVLRPMCRMFGVADDSIALPRRLRRKREPTAEQLFRRQLRAEAKEFAELSKTSSRKSVVPPGHTFPTNARDWAIWIRRNKRQARDARAANRKAGF